MKTKRTLLLLIASLGAASALLAQSVQFVVLDRQQNFVQTTAGSAGLNGATPYEWVVNLNGTGLVAPPFTFIFRKPDNTPYSSEERDPGKEWQAPTSILGQFATMAALHSAFPDGTYTIETNLGDTSALSIPDLIGTTNDGFANTPFVIGSQVGYTVSWVGNKMLFDPTKALTLTSTTFVDNYVMATGRIGLWLDDGISWPEVTNETSPGSFIFNSNTVQMVVPANTLLAGNYYNGGLEFNNVVGSGIVDLSGTYGAGAKGVSVYTAYTDFSIQAIPEPSTYAAIFGAVAMAGVMIRRRRAG